MTGKDGNVISFTSHDGSWTPYARRIAAASSPGETLDTAIQCVEEYAATLDEPARATFLRRVADEWNLIADDAEREMPR